MSTDRAEGSQMKCDFDIEASICLVKGEKTLDLHNCYEFTKMEYRLEKRSVSLHWQRSSRPEISDSLPASVLLKFRDVSHFEFKPRNSDQPFSEDDCLSEFGIWHDEHGLMLCENGIMNQDEPLAIGFMSGATIVLKASAAYVTFGTKTA